MFQSVVNIIGAAGIIIFSFLIGFHIKISKIMCKREIDINFCPGYRVYEFNFSFIPAPEQKELPTTVRSDEYGSRKFDEKYNKQYRNQKEDKSPLFGFNPIKQLLKGSDFFKIFDSPRVKWNRCFTDEFCRVFSGGHAGRLDGAMQLIQVGEDGFYNIIRNIIR